MENSLLKSQLLKSGKLTTFRHYKMFIMCFLSSLANTCFFNVASVKTGTKKCCDI